MTYNPPVLPPYSTDTFTVCKLHTSILTYFGRIAIFFVKNPGKGMGIPFLGVDFRGRLQQKGASIRYGDSFFWGMDFRGRLQRKGASIWKAGGIRRKVLPYGTLRKEEGRNRNALPLRSGRSSTKLENTSLSTDVPLGFLYAAFLLPPLQNGSRYVPLRGGKISASRRVSFSMKSRTNR